MQFRRNLDAIRYNLDANQMQSRYNLDATQMPSISNSDANR